MEVVMRVLLGIQRTYSCAVMLLIGIGIVPVIRAQSPPPAANSQLSAAQTSTIRPESATPQPMLAGETIPELLIGCGDLLEVSIYGVPDFDRQLRVSETGEISLPLIGAVHVAG